MPLSDTKALQGNLLQIFKHTSVYSIASLAQSAVSFVLLPLYLKFFTPEQYGIYSLLLMINSIGSAVFYLGINSALPTSFFESDDPEERRRVYSTALALTGCGSIFFIITCFLCGKMLSKHLFGNESEYLRIILIGFTGACGIIVQVILTLLRTLQKTKFVAFSSLAGVTVTLASTYLLVSQYQMGIDGPIFSGLAVQILLLICYMIFTKDWLTGRLDLHQAKILIKFGAPTILISFGVMTIDWSDRVLIQKYMGTSDVGIYSLASRLGTIVTPLLITPLAQVWNPMAFHEKKMGRYASASGQIITIYSAIGFMAIVAASLFVEDIFIYIFKANAYASGAKYVPLIMAANFLNGMNNFVTMGAIFERKLKKMVFNIYFLAATSLIANFILIKSLGAWGAVITVVIVNTLAPILSYWHAKQFHPIKFEISKIALISVLSAITIVIGLSAHWPSYPWLFITKVFLFVLYCLLLFLIVKNRERNYRLKNIRT